jgi:hypothetical protein
MRSAARLFVLSIVSAIAVASPAGSATAAAKTYVPTRTGDPAPNGCRADDCSLREAVIAANRHPGKDTIKLARKTYNLHLPQSAPDDETGGDLDITDPLAIKHPGRGRAVLDANRVDRAVQVTTSYTDRYTKFFKLVIRGGKAPNWGGGLLVGEGPVGLTKCVVTANRATYDGGGIFASAGELTLVKSTVKANRAGESGGGVGSIVETTIRNSTLNGNSAAGDTAGLGGGGLWYSGPELKMRNDTVANNRAVADGGGILTNFGAADLNNLTVARNVADSDNSGGGLGGGLRNDGATPTVANSILALNRYGNGNASDCSGIFSSAGRNLLTGLVGCAGFPTPPNLRTDHPRLGQLADNGGPTKTIALRRRSPAVGHAAKASAEKRDQRGHRRDKHPDIGAFER